jgi:hypothetical protein
MTLQETNARSIIRCNRIIAESEPLLALVTTEAKKLVKAQNLQEAARAQQRHIQARAQAEASSSMDVRGEGGVGRRPIVMQNLALRRLDLAMANTLRGLDENDNHNISGSSSSSSAMLAGSEQEPCDGDDPRKGDKGDEGDEDEDEDEDDDEIQWDDDGDQAAGMMGHANGLPLYSATETAMIERTVRDMKVHLQSTAVPRLRDWQQELSKAVAICRADARYASSLPPITSALKKIASLLATVHRLISASLPS